MAKVPKGSITRVLKLAAPSSKVKLGTAASVWLQQGSGVLVEGPCQTARCTTWSLPHFGQAKASPLGRKHYIKARSCLVQIPGDTIL